MNLSDLRRLCIRRQLRVTFADGNGICCCINEHGASLREGVAGWLQSEEDFARVTRFEVSVPGSKQVRKIDRAGLERLCDGVASSERGSGSAAKRMTLLQFQE